VEVVVSARRIIQRRAFFAQRESRWSHASRDRQAQRLNLAKIEPLQTYAEWIREVRS